MTFNKYWRGLSKTERAAYAERAETSPEYIRVHLFYGRKIPRRPLLERLAAASEGELNLSDVIDHFYPDAA